MEKSDTKNAVSANKRKKAVINTKVRKTDVAISDKSKNEIVSKNKRKVEVVIPELKDWVVQPNRITNARYEYTLIQERVFTAIMYKLQDAITTKINYNPFQNNQLDLFSKYESEKDDNTIKITIPLKEISDRSTYETTIKAIERMGGIPFSIPSVDKNDPERWTVLFLLKAIDTPRIGNRLRNLDIYVNRDIAKILIDVITNRMGQPIEYTRYVYQIAMDASSKYTSLLYKKICSWRKKGGFTILLDELYKDLCVNNVYILPNGRINYKNFKSKVLEKAKEELCQKADCWFDYSENYKGRSVHSINFKIITPQQMKQIDEYKEYIKNMLRDHFKITYDDINTYLSELFTDENFDHTRLLRKFAEINEAMHKIRIDKKNKLVDPKSYVMVSLMNFANELKNTKK